MQRSRQGAGTPFQEWCESLLRARGWTLRELARRLGVSASTSYHYRAGNVLPTVAMQRRLAELTGTPVQQLARLVWESKRGGGSEVARPVVAARPGPRALTARVAGPTVRAEPST